MAFLLLPGTTVAQTMTFGFDASKGHFDYSAEGVNQGDFADMPHSKLIDKLTHYIALRINERSAYEYTADASTDYVIEFDSIVMHEIQLEGRYDGLLMNMSSTRFRVIATLTCNNTNMSYPLRFERVFEDRINQYYDEYGNLASESLYKPDNTEILRLMAGSMSKHILTKLRHHKAQHRPQQAKRQKRKAARQSG